MVTLVVIFVMPESNHRPPQSNLVDLSISLPSSPTLIPTLQPDPDISQQIVRKQPTLIQRELGTPRTELISIPISNSTIHLRACQRNLSRRSSRRLSIVPFPISRLAVHALVGKRHERIPLHHTVHNRRRPQNRCGVVFIPQPQPIEPTSHVQTPLERETLVAV